jgi:hypothetical protein
MTLKFSFDTATRYWIDNVSVVDMSNGDNISNNGSVENFLGTSPWDVVTSTTNVGASRADIPVALRQNGTYTVELQVTDSTDEKSLPVSVEVTLEDCD